GFPVPNDVCVTDCLTPGGKRRHQRESGVAVHLAARNAGWAEANGFNTVKAASAAWVAPVVTTMTSASFSRRRATRCSYFGLERRESKSRSSISHLYFGSWYAEFVFSPTLNAPATPDAAEPPRRSCRATSSTCRSPAQGPELAGRVPCPPSDTCA